MHSADFTSAVTKHGGITLVKLSGELDVAGAPELRATFLEISGCGRSDVVVDVGDMSYLDSSGISVLVMSCKRFRSQGGRFTVRNASGSVRRVFEITGLVEYFQADGLAEPPSVASQQGESRPRPPCAS